MMTEEELANLQPGPDLNALVAKMVLGCSVVTVPVGYAANEYPFFNDEPAREEYFVCECLDRRHGIKGVAFHWLKHYSTNMGAAWSLTEHVGSRWVIDCVPRESQYIVRCQTSTDVCRVDGRNLPLAICLTALKAVRA
jgi:hypothetical protein